jgi:hypothetical protein
VDLEPTVRTSFFRAEPDPSACLKFAVFGRVKVLLQNFLWKLRSPVHVGLGIYVFFQRKKR